MADDCTEEESQGIGWCWDPGFGKTSRRCPWPGTDPSSWTCEEWKCHIWCTSSAGLEERTPCDACEDFVDVSAACFQSHVAACESAVGNDTFCDIDCNSAYSAQLNCMITVLMGLFFGLTVFAW